VTSVSLNRDGTCVCTASHDGLIRLWDVATGECLKTIFAAGNPPVCSAKFSPNGKYLLSGTLDSVIRLWPVTTTSKSPSCSKTYSSPDHIHTKFSVVSDFMPGYFGNIVTGSENGSVVIYDLQSKNVRQILKGHKDSVLAVSAHDKRPLLASGGMMADRKVEFWSLRKTAQRSNGDGDVTMDDDALLKEVYGQSKKVKEGES
jgi:COMPASS component SWD3